MKRSTSFYIGLSLFIVYFVLALQYGVFIGNFKGDLVLKDDALFYRTTAANIAQGRGYSFDGKTPFAARQIGYPLFLAFLFKLFGNNLILVFIVQYFLGAVSLVLFFWILIMMRCSKFSIVLGLILYFTNHMFFYFPNFILSETLGIFLFLVFIFAIIKYFVSSQTAYIYLASLACGGLILVKNIFQFLPLFLLIVCLIFKRKFIKEATALFLISSAIIAPVLIRNKIIFGYYSLSFSNIFWSLRSVLTEGSFANKNEFFDNLTENNIKCLVALPKAIWSYPVEAITSYIGNFLDLNFSLYQLNSNFNKNLSLLRLSRQFLTIKNSIVFLITLYYLFIQKQIFNLFHRKGFILVSLVFIYYNFIHSFFTSNLRYGLFSQILLYVICILAIDRHRLKAPIRGSSHEKDI